MDIFYSDHFVLPLPPGHRFPMSKYALLRERVLVSPLAVEAHVPEPASDEQLVRVHCPDYLARLVAGEMTKEEMRRIGFPWSPQMVQRSRRSSGATLAACRAALSRGTAANLAGGTHHAYRDHGEGFCVFNDAAVAARVLQAEGAVARVIVIDCDVHQGNGTASIFAGDPEVLTFSIHGANNFPFVKETSDLDIELPDRTGDRDYLQALERGLEEAMPRARPALAIFLAGADPFEGDRLGRLSLSKRGLWERDRMVFETCERYGVPVAVAMAGGYAKNIEDTVDIHYATLETAAWFCRG